MKKIAFFVLAASLCTPLFVRAQAPSSPPDAAAGGLRFSIAVSKFENHANYSGPFQLSDTWGSMLTDSLQQSGHFIVIGEADMREAAMKEQDFAKSGRVAGGDKAPATGFMTPAQLLIKGEITNFQTTSGQSGGIGFGGISLHTGGDTAEINAVLYVVDSTTGQVVASHKMLGKVKSGGLSVGFSQRDWSGDMGGFKKTNVGTAMEQAIDDGVAFIITQIPSLHWSGNVILVKAPMIYINRGTREGVSVGQQFKVGSSEVLRDPATGETLDVAFTEKGRIKVETAKEKISICSIVSGDGFENGMSVAPITP
ncbi:MAG TPA: CsgG/HfaB family protein [Opitutaceae bacterium]|jgi:curli biogenesis system outer membrane secretion channel CsgG|nr:CsgG/HfaB family protein [Opitutaceae bacterium]